MPVLKGILVETVDNKTIKLTATDIEMGIEYFIPAEIKEEGKTVLAEDYFTGLVNELPDTNIEIKTKEQNNVSLTSNNSLFKIGDIGAEQFPSFPEVKGEKYIVKREEFSRLLEQTNFAVSKDETRPYLTGTLFEIEDDELRMIATDTRRMALSYGNIETENNEKDTSELEDSDLERVIIPGKTLREINRIISGSNDDESEISITISDKNLLFNIDGTAVFSRVIEGQFPDYKQFIPDNLPHHAVVDRRKFLSICRRAQMIAKKSQIVVVEFDDIIKIKAESEYGDEGYEEIESDYSGSPLKVGFNVRYITDFLESINAEKISIELKGSLEPTVFRPSNIDTYTYILMPVRLQ